MTDNARRAIARAEDLLAWWKIALKTIPDKPESGETFSDATRALALSIANLNRVAAVLYMVPYQEFPEGTLHVGKCNKYHYRPSEN